MPKNVDILLITLSSPIMIGIYENSKLIETIKSDKKSSDILAVVFDDLFKTYNIKGLFFANGPGSFMAIKVAYIFLKSISIIKGIELFATDAFKFNENNPIKAIGKLYFVKVADKIRIQKFDLVPTVALKLPKLLDYSEFTTETAPSYKIGAVN